MPRSNCPNPDDLRRWQREDLPPERQQDVALHLESCTACRAVLGIPSDSRESAFARERVPPPPDKAADSPPALVAPGFFSQRTHASAQLFSWNDPYAGLRPGARLGQYELEASLGRGGMGIVYRARHLKLKKPFALKFLPAEQVGNQRWLQRFEREMQAAGRVNHVNVINASDAGEFHGLPYLAMEYVDGVNLAQLVRAQGPLRVPDACELIRQAAEGLAEIHLAKMIHRDIKPSNLMLSREGVVKILDLGLAALRETEHDPREPFTSQGQVLGTLEFMAPEQADDSRRADILSDIYGLGATLFYLLTGRAPFDVGANDHPAGKLRALLTERPTPIGQVRPDVPKSLAQLVDRLLAVDPAERIKTPTEVAHALRAHCESSNLVNLARLAENGSTDACADERQTASLPTTPLVQSATDSIETSPEPDGVAPESAEPPDPPAIVPKPDWMHSEIRTADVEGATRDTVPLPTEENGFDPWATLPVPDAAGFPSGSSSRSRATPLSKPVGPRRSNRVRLAILGIAALALGLAWGLRPGRDAKDTSVQPKDTQPKDTQPKDTQPKDTQPKDTQPKDTQPKDTQPKDTQPKDTQPKDTQPDHSQPNHSQPSSARHDESKLLAELRAQGALNLGQTWYVDPQGTLADDKSRRTLPSYLSLVQYANPSEDAFGLLCQPRPATAVELAPGDVVVFLPGRHDQLFVTSVEYQPAIDDELPLLVKFAAMRLEDLHGTVDKPILLVAEPGAVFGARRSTSLGPWEREVDPVHLVHCSHVKLLGFEVTGFGNGIRLSDCEDVEIAHAWVHDVNGEHHNFDAGVQIESCRRIDVHHVLFQNPFAAPRAEINSERLASSRCLLAKGSTDVRVHHCQVLVTDGEETEGEQCQVHAMYADSRNFEVDHNVFVGAFPGAIGSECPETRVHHNLLLDGLRIGLSAIRPEEESVSGGVEHNTLVRMHPESTQQSVLVLAMEQPMKNLKLAFEHNLLSENHAHYDPDRGTISIEPYGADSLFDEILQRGLLSFERNHYFNASGALQFNLCGDPETGAKGGVYTLDTWRQIGFDQTSKVGDPDFDEAWLPAHVDAAACGWYAGDRPRLTVLLIDANLLAGESVRGRVVRSGIPIEQPLVVQLHVGQSGVLQCPTSISIPAFASQATFLVKARREAGAVFAQAVEVTASANSIEDCVPGWVRVACPRCKPLDDRQPFDPRTIANLPEDISRDELLDMARGALAHGDHVRTAVFLEKALGKDPANRALLAVSAWFTLERGWRNFRDYEPEQGIEIVLQAAIKIRELRASFAPLTTIESSLAARILYDEACVHALRGHRDDCLNSLREAHQAGFPNLLRRVQQDRDFNRLRDDPDFEQGVKNL